MTDAGRSKTDPRLTLRAKEHNHVLWREEEKREGEGGERREGGRGWREEGMGGEGEGEERRVRG